MKQDLLKEIGKLSIREEKCSEEEINRIYNLVMEKKHHEKKRFHKRRIKISIISFAAAAAIMCVCVYSIRNSDVKNSNIKDNNVKEDKENKVVQQTTEAPVIVEQKDRIVVSVYVAKDKNQVVTANYGNELTMKKVKAGEKVNIGTYSLLSSSVPGYPLMVNDEKQKNNGKDITIKIETDGGSLLSWDSETGDVKDKGKNTSFKLDEKIYWSPLESSLENEKISTKANLKIAMYEGNKIIGETELYIYEEQEASYVVERVS